MSEMSGEKVKLVLEGYTDGGAVQVRVTKELFGLTPEEALVITRHLDIGSSKVSAEWDHLWSGKKSQRIE